MNIEMPHNGQGAQGSLEYLLILSAGAAIIAIVGLLLFDTLDLGTGTTDCTYDFVQQNIVLPPNGVNITNPTTCKKFTDPAQPYEFSVDFNYGSKVDTFMISIKNKATSAVYSCTGAPVNVTLGQTGMRYDNCGTAWSPGSPPAGDYDLNVMAITDGVGKSAIEPDSISLR